MKLLPDWLRSAIDDGTGQVSATRVATLSTLFAAAILPGLVWAELSLLNNKMLEFPVTLTGYMTAAGTLVVTLFIINKRTE